MHYNNDRWYPEPNRESTDGKLRTRSFWQRHRWIIIALTTLAVLVVIFASTTWYLLTNRPNPIPPQPTPPIAQTPPTVTQSNATSTPEPTATTMTVIPTVTNTTPSSQSSLTTTTKDYLFICVTNCDGSPRVILNDINLNTTNQNMAWDFTITNNGEVCNNMYGSLSLQSPTGDTITANGGTFTIGITVNANQTLPRTATFSSIPQQKIQYTVTLQMGCYNSATYQPVLFSY